MKVTVRPSSVEKALDQNNWPYRVGVRHCHAPNRNRQNDGDRQFSNRRDNGADNNYNSYSQQTPRPRYRAPRKTSNMEDSEMLKMFNMYTLLREQQCP